MTCKYLCIRQLSLDNEWIDKHIREKIVYITLDKQKPESKREGFSEANVTFFEKMFGERNSDSF